MDVVEEVRPEQVWDRERERVKKKEKEKELPSESLVFKQLRKFTPIWAIFLFFCRPLSVIKICLGLKFKLRNWFWLKMFFNSSGLSFNSIRLQCPR